MAKGSNTPLIIKKVKKVKASAHHGGAWKVAYADFVTAMMSFFLLLWLLNVTTDVQKRGIADYFDPTIASKSQSGAGGVLGGLSMGQPGAQDVSASPPALQLAVATLRQPEEGEEGDVAGSSSQSDTGDKAGGTTTSSQSGGTTSSEQPGGATASAKKPVEQMTEMELQK